MSCPRVSEKLASEQAIAAVGFVLEGQQVQHHNRSVVWSAQQLLDLFGLGHVRNLYWESPVYVRLGITTRLKVDE